MTGKGLLVKKCPRVVIHVAGTGSEIAERIIASLQSRLLSNDTNIADLQAVEALLATTPEQQPVTSILPVDELEIRLQQARQIKTFYIN